MLAAPFFFGRKALSINMAVVKALTPWPFCVVISHFCPGILVGVRGGVYWCAFSNSWGLGKPQTEDWATGLSIGVFAKETLYGCEKRTMVSFYLILAGIHNIELTTYLALQKTLKPLWDFFPITASECPVSTAMVSLVALIRLFCRFQLRKDAAMVVSVSGHRKNITPKVVLWFHCWGAQVLLTCKRLVSINEARAERVKRRCTSEVYID